MCSMNYVIYIAQIIDIPRYLHIIHSLRISIHDNYLSAYLFPIPIDFTGYFVLSLFVSHSFSHGEYVLRGTDGFGFSAVGVDI